MIKGTRRWVLGCAVALCIICLPMLLVYAFPRGQQSADWSIQPEDGQEWQGDKGWTVFVVRDGERTLLTPDGVGGYKGCEPGETFFCSRSWDVDIAQPTLRIHAVTATVAVWLNDTLYYTDAPLAEQTPAKDIVLPPLNCERYNPIEIPLYDVSRGATLTIAQTAPLVSEIPGKTVYPCPVEVVSTYGYERGLIASAYNTGFLCALLGIVGIMLCVLAVWQKKAAWLLVALMAFVRAAYVVGGAPFFSPYTLIYAKDYYLLASLFSFTLMLGFLATQLGRTHGIAIALAVLHCVSVIASLITQVTDAQFVLTAFLLALPERLTLFLLPAELGLCLWTARKGNDFSRMFLRVFAVGVGLCLPGEIVWLAFHRDTLSNFLSGHMFYARFLREPTIWLTQGAGLIVVLIQAYRRAAAAQEERVFASLRAQAMQQSYEGLRVHQDEVMMLRHEMNRHFAALTELLRQGQTQRAQSYLNELLKKQESIPQVISSPNELVNIILNSRAAMAQSLGLRVEIERMNVPAKLPISDADVVSLLMNIVDNAIDAAGKAEKQPGVLRLNMNCKNEYFTFSCENTMAIHETKETKSPYHGYGLHIIERIMARYGNLMTVRQEAGMYSITIALPLMRDTYSQPTHDKERSETV